jgi:hypothetical protein
MHDDLLYGSLFADDARYFETMRDHPVISWIFSGQKIDEARVQSIIGDNDVESRMKFLVSSYALKSGIRIPGTTYFGSILEVPLQGGYDILAFYADDRARYYNYSNKAIIYEGGSVSINTLIDTANTVSKGVCQVIGPWEKERLPRPTGSTARFTYLMSDGLYFGQGPLDALSRDQMGSAILSSGARLMRGLIDLAGET